MPLGLCTCTFSAPLCSYGPNSSRELVPKNGPKTPYRVGEGKVSSDIFSFYNPVRCGLCMEGGFFCGSQRLGRHLRSSATASVPSTASSAARSQARISTAPRRRELLAQFRLLAVAAQQR